MFAERGKIRRALVLPCGQCIGCRLERSRQWAVRCLHEQQSHSQNCFVTLTYDEDHVPVGLRYRDFQLFMKRLRKVFPCARFYMCGEYGEQFRRPHFHACLFGVDFADKVLFRRGSHAGLNLYTSAVLSRIWTDGFASVGQLSFESAAYVARYVMKKVTGDRAEAHYAKLDLATGEIVPIVPEFNRMSLKPGIGAAWLAKYTTDVFPRDYVVVNGVKCKPPRYYDKQLTVLDYESSELVSVLRYARSMEVIQDNSPERLRVREVVTRARLAFKSRLLE